jgi:hypothetical protein
MNIDNIFTILPLITGVLIAIAINYLDSSKLQVRGIVGPFFASIAIIFALFSSLLASEVWNRASEIRSEMIKEVSSLRSLHRLVKALDIPGEVVEEKLDFYIQSVVSGQYARSRDDSKEIKIFQAKASDTLQSLHKFAIDAKNFQNNVSANSAFLNELIKLRDSRFKRNSLEDSHANPIKILSLFIFGFLTQIAIALCHCGNVRASYWSVGLFSVAFATSVGLITAFDNPLHSTNLIIFNYISQLWEYP